MELIGTSDLFDAYSIIDSAARNVFGFQIFNYHIKDERGEQMIPLRRQDPIASCTI
jgi:hypothetical protein